jgi:hypothetical protein
MTILSQHGVLIMLTTVFRPEANVARFVLALVIIAKGVAAGFGSFFVKPATGKNAPRRAVASPIPRLRTTPTFRSDYSRDLRDRRNRVGPSFCVATIVRTFARGSNGGLVVTASLFGANHPSFIATLPTRFKLPAIFPFRYYVTWR